jgi:MFS family permease
MCSEHVARYFTDCKHRYQGILGACVGLGGVAGPFIAAAFVPSSTWRGIFWTITGLATISGLLVAAILPPSVTTGSTRQKLRTIDYWGLSSSSIGLILLLIPISGGGIYFEWDSPMVISMLTLGSISMLVFIVVEWKFAIMPMVPLRLFRSLPITGIISQQFLLGIVHYSQLYILPIYYQNVRQFSTLKAATLMIPYVVAQSVFSILSGQYISQFKRYGEVIWLGYTLWLVGAGLLIMFDERTKPYAMVLVLIVEGAGVGLVFQPTLIAAQAHSSKNDRAVVISVRNFSRALGGAVGLAISPAVFSNVFYARTAQSLPVGLRQEVQNINLGVPDWNRYSEENVRKIIAAYASASRMTFIVWVPIMATCLALCSMIKDKGLQRQEELTPESRDTKVEVTNTQQSRPRDHVSDLEKNGKEGRVSQTPAV